MSLFSISTQSNMAVQSNITIQLSYHLPAHIVPQSTVLWNFSPNLYYCKSFQNILKNYHKYFVKVLKNLHEASLSTSGESVKNHPKVS